MVQLKHFTETFGQGELISEEKKTPVFIIAFQNLLSFNVEIAMIFSLRFPSTDFFLLEIKTKTCNLLSPVSLEGDSLSVTWVLGRSRLPDVEGCL